MGYVHFINLRWSSGYKPVSAATGPLSNRIEGIGGGLQQRLVGDWQVEVQVVDGVGAVATLFARSYLTLDTRRANWQHSVLLDDPAAGPEVGERLFAAIYGPDLIGMIRVLHNLFSTLELAEGAPLARALFLTPEDVARFAEGQQDLAAVTVAHELLRLWPEAANAVPDMTPLDVHAALATWNQSARGGLRSPDAPALDELPTPSLPLPTTVVRPRVAEQLRAVGKPPPEAVTVGHTLPPAPAPVVAPRPPEPVPVGDAPPPSTPVGIWLLLVLGGVLVAVLVAAALWFGIRPLLMGDPGDTEPAEHPATETAERPATPDSPPVAVEPPQTAGCQATDEIPGDGIDQDCDLVDHCYEDGDGDGAGIGAPRAGGDLACAAPGDAAVAGDCDDRDASVHPGATELCDARDNDCDGAVDEGWDDLDRDGTPECREVDAWSGVRVSDETAWGRSNTLAFAARVTEGACAKLQFRWGYTDEGTMRQTHARGVTDGRAGCLLAEERVVDAAAARFGAELCSRRQGYDQARLASGLDYVIECCLQVSEGGRASEQCREVPGSRAGGGAAYRVQ